MKPKNVSKKPLREPQMMQNSVLKMLPRKPLKILINVPKKLPKKLK